MTKIDFVVNEHLCNIKINTYIKSQLEPVDSSRGAHSLKKITFSLYFDNYYYKI